MPAPLSIIIATRDVAETLPQTLRALMEGVEAGIIRELIIADGGSRDATLTIAEAAGADVVSADGGFGASLRRAADAARGPWLLFLHHDSHLDRGWVEAVSRHMASGSGGYFWLRYRTVSFGAWQVSRWRNLRSRLFGLPSAEQGLLISKEAYAAAGGYEDVGAWAHERLARRLDLSPIRHVARAGPKELLGGKWILPGATGLLGLLRAMLSAPKRR